MSGEPLTRADRNRAEAIAFYLSNAGGMSLEEIARIAYDHVAAIDTQHPDAIEDYRYWAGVAAAAENIADAYHLDEDPRTIEPETLARVAAAANTTVTEVLLDAAPSKR